MKSKNLQSLGLKEDEVKIFIFLLQNPNQTAGYVAKKLGLSRPSLYWYLKNLIEKSFVTESQKNGVKIFNAVEEEKIKFILDEKSKEITEIKKDIESVFNEIRKGFDPHTPPRFEIYEGVKDMQKIAKDILLHRNIHTKSYWPIKLMIEVLGVDFFKEFNKERVKRNIYIDAIWPEKQMVDMKKYPFMGAGGDFLREIRVAPESADFKMGYWIYENKVALISSKKDNFGFIIESKEYSEMMRSQFDIIWKLSKPLKVKEEVSKKLFKEMMEK